MRQVLVGVLFVVLGATSVNAASSEEEARSAYEKGDYARAVVLMRPFAEQGQAWAQNGLGWMYQQGQGVPKDDQKAVMWYRKAAEQGDAAAQYDLGWMYESGTGVPEDDEEAAAWIRKAAEQGHTLGQFSLGVMYEKGIGVQRDLKEAEAWFRKAAEQGHMDAQFNLGEMYRYGQGVPKDRVRAYMWLSLAYAASTRQEIKDPLGTYIESLERDLTTEEMDKAQALAQRCLDTKFKQCG